MAYGRCTPMRDKPMGEARYEKHAYEGHAYGMASVRNTPMRDTPIYIGWRKGVAFVAGGGGGYRAAGVSRSTRRCTYAGKRRCLRYYRRLGRAPARHTSQVTNRPSKV